MNLQATVGCLSSTRVFDTYPGCFARIIILPLWQRCQMLYDRLQVHFWPHAFHNEHCIFLAKELVLRHNFLLIIGTISMDKVSRNFLGNLYIQNNCPNFLQNW